MYEKFSFYPMLGLSGSGKSEFIEQLQKTGKQVLSIEKLLDVRGICLKNVFDTVSVGQDEFDALLTAEFSTFDAEKAIYIEWKPVSIMGIKLPEELIGTVRDNGCWVTPRPKNERIARLLTQYSEWQDHMDIIADMIAGRILHDDGRQLKSIADSGDAKQFVEALLAKYFDPLYISEIAEFKGGAYFGELDAEKGYFLGTYIPSPSLLTIRQSVSDLD